MFKKSLVSWSTSISRGPEVLDRWPPPWPTKQRVRVYSMFPEFVAPSGAHYITMRHCNSTHDLSPFFSSIFTHSTHHNSHYFVATHTTIFTWGKVPSNLFHFRINIESYACLFNISRLCRCFRRICHLFLWLCNVLQELDVTNFRGIFHIGKNTNLPFDITFHFPFCPL